MYYWQREAAASFVQAAFRSAATLPAAASEPGDACLVYEFKRWCVASLVPSHPLCARKMAAKPLPDDPLPALLDALSFVFSFALAAITAITLQVVRLLDALFVSQFLQATHKHLDWLLFCIGAPPLAVFSCALLAGWVASAR
jgi:hypothetical protein